MGPPVELFVEFVIRDATPRTPIPTEFRSGRTDSRLERGRGRGFKIQVAAGLRFFVISTKPSSDALIRIRQGSWALDSYLMSIGGRRGGLPFLISNDNLEARAKNKNGEICLRHESALAWDWQRITVIVGKDESRRLDVGRIYGDAWSM